MNIDFNDESTVAFMNSLPFMYARYEVIRDANGFIRDSRCLAANSVYKSYYKSVDPVGMLRSELLTESNPFWNFHATQCLCGHDVETWEYNGTHLGELNVIMRRVDNDTIDVYTINMDSDRQMEKRRRAEFNEILKAKYLCKIKIWHWDMQTNKIYSKETLYGEEALMSGLEEERDYLIWNSSDLINCIQDETERKSLMTAVENLMYDKAERQEVYVHMNVMGRTTQILTMLMVDERNEKGAPISIIGCTRIASKQ